MNRNKNQVNICKLATSHKWSSFAVLIDWLIGLFRDCQAHQAVRVPRVNRAARDLQVWREQTVDEETREDQEIEEHREHQDDQGTQEQAAPPDSRVHSVHQDPSVSRYASQKPTRKSL